MEIRKIYIHETTSAYNKEVQHIGLLLWWLSHSIDNYQKAENRQ